MFTHQLGGPLRCPRPLSDPRVSHTKATDEGVREVVSPGHIAGGTECEVRAGDTAPGEAVHRADFAVAALTLLADTTGSTVQQPQIKLSSVAHSVVLSCPTIPDYLDSAGGTLRVLEPAYGDQSTNMTLPTVLVPPHPVWTSHHAAPHVKQWNHLTLK